MGLVFNPKIQFSDKRRNDEMFVKMRCSLNIVLVNMKYLFGLMDDETKYWITKEIADMMHMARTNDVR